jgi:hypothetical protein
VCSRKCNEAPRKRRQREHAYKLQLAAAKEAVKQFEQLPQRQRPNDWRSFVAKEASLILIPKLRFARTFVTQAVQARKLKPPAELS